LTAGRESIYLSWFYDEYSERAGAVQPDDLAEYVRCYSQLGSMRCGFEYYRTLEISSAFVQASIERDGKPPLPVLSLFSFLDDSNGVRKKTTMPCSAIIATRSR
jgi:hypothetical protein